VSKLSSRPKIYGEVRLRTVKGKIIKRNTIVNLSALLNLVAYTTSTPSSIKTPIIATSAGSVNATYSIQQYENGYVFIFTATFQQPVNIISASLYPYSMSVFTKPLASIIYTKEITGVVQIEWAIYVQDVTGILLNLIPPQTIPSTNFTEVMYVEDNNVNAVLNMNNYDRYLYAYFQDPTNGNPITYVKPYFFTFLNYTDEPSAVTINNKFALQVLPAVGSTHSTFYYVSNSPNFIMQFTFTHEDFFIADGFTICLYSTTPPIAINTNVIHGMSSSYLVYGSGNQIVVEFDPIASQPISVTWWTEQGYQQTILSSNGVGDGFSMKPGDEFIITIVVSGTSMTITVTDLTINKTLISQTVTLPFTPPNISYTIVTVRNGEYYTNWTLINLQDWYPYSVQIPVNYTSPQLLPVTVIYDTD